MIDTTDVEVKEHNSNYPNPATLSDDEQLSLIFNAMSKDSRIHDAVLKSIGESSTPVAKKPLTLNTKVKTYKTVIKAVTCHHCGTTIRREIQLSPEEGTIIINRNGTNIRIHYTQVDDKAELISYTSYCNNCTKFIKSLNRNELEARYHDLLLMATCSIARGGMSNA